MTAHPAHRASTRRSPQRLAAITAATALAVSGLALAPAQAADSPVANDDRFGQYWTDGDHLNLVLQGDLLANDQLPAGSVVTDVTPTTAEGEPEWDVAWTPGGDVTFTRIGSWDGRWQGPSTMDELGYWTYSVETPDGETSSASVMARLDHPETPFNRSMEIVGLEPTTIYPLGTGDLDIPLPPDGRTGRYEILEVVDTHEGIASATVGADGQSIDLVLDPETLGDRESVLITWRLRLPTGQEGTPTHRIDIVRPELERPFDIAYHQPGLVEAWGDDTTVDLTLAGNRRVSGNLLDLSGIEVHPGATVEVTGVTASAGWEVGSWTPGGDVAVRYAGSWADTWRPTGTVSFDLKASNGWTGSHSADLALEPSSEWLFETEEWSHISLSTTDRGETLLYPDLAGRAPVEVPTGSGQQATRFRATSIVEVGPGFDDARIVNDGRAVEVDVAEGIHDGSSQSSEYWLVIEKVADTGGPAVRQRIWSVMEPGFMARDDSAAGNVEEPITVDVLANDSTLYQDPYREAPLDVVDGSLPADVTAEVDDSNNVVVVVPEQLAGEAVEFNYRVEGRGGDVATPTVTVTAGKATQKEPKDPKEPKEPKDPKKPEKKEKDRPKIDAGL